MLSENLCHPRHHKRGNRVSGGVERSETVLESSSLPAVRTGEGLLVYRVRERQQFVQEKGLWCTEWGKDRSSYRRRPVVYKVGERRQFVQEKGLWCTEWGKDGSSYRRRASGVQIG